MGYQSPRLRKKKRLHYHMGPQNRSDDYLEQLIVKQRKDKRLREPTRDYEI